MNLDEKITTSVKSALGEYVFQVITLVAQLQAVSAENELLQSRLREKEINSDAD